MKTLLKFIIQIVDIYMGVDLLRSKLQHKKLRSVITIRSGLSKQREITTNWGTQYMKCCFPKCWCRTFVSHTTQEMTVAAKKRQTKQKYKNSKTHYLSTLLTKIPWNLSTPLKSRR